jgi:hypothetical protein
MICLPERWPSYSARDQLEAIVNTLGADEVRVLTEIASRLQRGAQIYGRLDLDTDKRDFAREGHEELQDYLVYFACERLKKAGAR